MAHEYGDKSFEGQAVLVTGGASGMGREIARAFASTGARVMASDVDEPGLRSLAHESGDRIEVRAADVTREAEVSELVAQTVASLGGIDINVNCAGGSTGAPLLELSEADWDRDTALNLKGNFLALKHSAIQMRAQGRGGVIINLTSVTAQLSTSGQAPTPARRPAPIT